MENQSQEKTEQTGSIPIERSIVVYVGPVEEVTAQDAVKPEEKREIAYYIRDEQFDELAIVKSDNAWWMEPMKVRRLIDAFKSGMSVKAAIFYAGISKNKYYYFLEIHPEFSEVIENLEGAQEGHFINLINTEGIKDLTTARWYLEKTHPKFMGKKVEEDKGGNTNIQNNVVITQNNKDTAEITRAIEKLADSILKGSGFESSAPVDRSGMEEEG